MRLISAASTALAPDASSTADHAAAYLRERGRLLTLLARLDASVDEWRAQGRPRAAVLLKAPSVSLGTLARVRLALAQTLGRLDG